MKVRKAVIPAAGFGTRFLPATKAQPKEMLPILDKPTIQFVVEEAVRAGIEDIIIVTGRSKRAIEDHFDRSAELEVFLERHGKTDELQMVRAIADLAEVHFVRQKEPLGLGHAILCAQRHIGNEPFAVLLGDDIVRGSVPCTRQLIEAYQATGRSVVAVQEVTLAEVNRYGIVAPIGEAGPNLYTLSDLVEKPAPEHAPSNLAIIGRYVLSPSVFEALGQVEPDARGEIQLTTALEALNRSEGVNALRFDGRRYDVGDRLGFLQATVEFALERADLGPEFRHYLTELLRTTAPVGTSSLGEKLTC